VRVDHLHLISKGIENCLINIFEVAQAVTGFAKFFYNPQHSESFQVELYYKLLSIQDLYLKQVLYGKENIPQIRHIRSETPTRHDMLTYFNTTYPQG